MRCLRGRQLPCLSVQTRWRAYRPLMPPTDPSPEQRFDRVLGRGRGAVGPDSAMVRLRPGDRIGLVLPFSEACIHHRVAGKRRTVELTGADPHLIARVLDAAGRVVAGALLPEEAGLHRDEHGYHARREDLA